MTKPRIDRLAMRGRPRGSPVIHQRWEKLLFLHWPVNPNALRPLIPPALELDLFERQAWIGITPFHVSNMRPVGLPPLPGMREFEEINVRTYVRHGDVPGIWFFSLDTSKLVPSVAARYTYGLPYYKAKIEFTTTQSWHAFSHKRAGPPAAEFGASWRAGQRLRAPDKESLAFFLVERYCAFAVQGNQVQQIRIYHHPWILSEAMVNLHSSSLIAALGLAEPVSEPLAHFTEPMDVEIWPPAEAQAMGEPRSRRIAVRAD